MPLDNPSPFGFEAAGQSPGFLLWQCTMIWQRRIKKALAPYGVSHPQFVVLANLLWQALQGEETTQAKLSQSTKMDKMTLSNAIRLLAKAHYLTHSEHPDDARVKAIKLTATGEELAHQLVPIVENVDEAFFDKLHQNDQHKITQLLHLLTIEQKKSFQD